VFVRHWHELGYLILYITARPDMQLRMVVSWLAQHNFPHGIVAFMDGLSAEPLRQKTNYLRHLVQEVRPAASKGSPGDAKCVTEIVEGGGKNKDVRGDKMFENSHTSVFNSKIIEGVITPDSH